MRRVQHAATRASVVLYLIRGHACSVTSGPDAPFNHQLPSGGTGLARHRVGLVVASVLAILAIAMPAHAMANQGRGVIVGGIAPCTGLPPSMVKNLPRFAAGTVYVYRGRIGHFHTSEHLLHLLARSVVRQTVQRNHTYRFVLPPGPYVLVAHYPNGNVRPFVQATVRSGATAHVDIPNMCK